MSGAGTLGEQQPVAATQRGCPTENELVEFLEGALAASPLRVQRIEDHLDACLECSELVGVMLGAAGSRTSRGEHGAGSPASDAFAETLASDGPARLQGTLGPGARLGRYLIIERVGAGGMGVVYAGYDPELDRKIALKLVRVPVDASPDAVAVERARLLNEARALARLRHPNVIVVHDVGTDASGDVYVAMEFMDGQTLDAWMSDEARTQRELVEVFSAAGRGLAAAHAEGLVHRDFKPGNVMLDRRGVARVLDFGLARPLDPGGGGGGEATGARAPGLPRSPGLDLTTPITRTGALVGTPAYMSPEQFAGRPADARSDQFSFCVALYEGLYGERPFAAASMAELMLAVVEGRVRPPSASPRTRVRPWLRAVLLRGLATDPAARWPSMPALLEALARDPVQRRRRIVGVTAALAGVTIAGAFAWARLQGDAACEGGEERVATVWSADRRARIGAGFAGVGAGEGAAIWDEVARQLDVYAARWAAAYTELCRATRVRGERSELLLDRGMQCLSRRTARIDALLEVFEDVDPGVISNARTAVRGLAPIEPCLDRDALLAELPPPEDPETARRVTALRERVERGHAFEAAGKYTEGIEHAWDTVDAAMELDYAPAQAEALVRLGALLNRGAQFREAVEPLETAYFTALRVGHTRAAAEAANTLIYVMGVPLREFEASERWIDHAEALVLRSGDTLLEGNFHNIVGALELTRGDHDRAIGQLRLGLELRAAALGDDHPALASSLSNIGMVLVGHREFDEALAAFERALAIRETHYGPDHPAVARVLESLGGVQVRLGEYDVARVTYERVLAIRERTGAGTLHHARAHLGIAGLYLNTEEYARLEEHARRSISIYEQHGLGHSPLAVYYLGVGLQGLGREAEAVAAFERARDEMKRGRGDVFSNLHLPVATLGAIAYKRGDLHEARALYLEALTSLEALQTPNPISVASSLSQLARIESLLGEHERARDYAERALIAVAEHQLGPRHQSRVDYTLAQVLLRAGEAPALSRARARAAYDVIEDRVDLAEHKLNLDGWVGSFVAP